ncbi:ImmA/IrrE family metallo-endopeptidase [Sedimenticola selenatireducens]|nr:ImmA/IrrE family metallo-endopeptidase [Sedimenticola selenatireducens]
MSTSQKSTGAEKLQLIETGGKDPTQAQLISMAEVYHRPLITFYLVRPPIKGDRGEDFRKLPPDFSREENALLDALLRDVKARQSMVRALLEDEDEADRLDFVGSSKRSAGVEVIAEAIRSRLGISLEAIRSCGSKNEVFNFIRQRAEDAGVFVLLIGDLGSHHTDIGTDIFRGFAIADDVAPFIVINDNDSKGAWSFTLLHELAHLWLGEEGVSNSSAWADNQIEKFCNNVAGEILLPDVEVLGLNVTPNTSRSDVVHVIQAFSSETNLSNTLIAYNLYRTGKLTLEQYQELSREFRQRWFESKPKSKDGSGPTYHILRRHRLGAAIVNLMARMLRGGAVSPTKAAKILGIKAHNISQVLGS